MFLTKHPPPSDGYITMGKCIYKIRYTLYVECISISQGTSFMPNRRMESDIARLEPVQSRGGILQTFSLCRFEAVIRQCETSFRSSPVINLV